MAKATEQTTEALSPPGTVRKSGAPPTAVTAGGSGFATLLGAPGILALQRTAGNRATTAWIESQRRTSATAVQRHASANPAPVSIQRRLLSQTDEALKAAIQHNPTEYGGLDASVDAYVPDDEQKKINDVEPASMKASNLFSKIGRFFSKKPAREEEQRAGLLTKFVRAVIYHEYLDRVRPLEQDKSLDATEKAKKRRGYLERTLLNRDKQAGLLKKGIGSTEAQSFLQSWGLLPDQAKASDEETGAQVKNAPRVDVRSTFIGGPILGINVRAHLYIVYTLADGRMYYIRGGPGADQDKGDRPMGSTTVDVGQYAPGTIDWDPSAPSKTILTGSAADGKLDAFIEAAIAINSMRVPYVGRMRHKASLLSGENCNAAAWTVLDRVGIPKAKPSGVHPGWGHQLGQHSGKGAEMPEAEHDEPSQSRGLPKEVTVYRDRVKVEILTKLPEGTTIDIVGQFGEIAKIRFQSNDKPAVGYIDIDDLNNAPEDKDVEQDKAEQKLPPKSAATVDVPIWAAVPSSGDEKPDGHMNTGDEFEFNHVDEDTVHEDDKAAKYVEVMYGGWGFCYMRVDDLRRAGYTGKLPGGGNDLAPKGEGANNQGKANAAGDNKKVDEHPVDFQPDYEIAIANTEVDLSDRTTAYLPQGAKVQVNPDYVRGDMSQYQPVFIEFIRDGKVTTGRVNWGALKRLEVPKGVEGAVGEDNSGGAGEKADQSVGTANRYRITSKQGQTVEVEDFQGEPIAELPHGTEVTLLDPVPDNGYQKVMIKFKDEGGESFGLVYFDNLVGL